MSGKTYGAGKHPIMAQLRALRNAASLSLDGLAEKLGVASVAIGSWERGDRQPTLGAVDHVLAEFGYELRAVPVGSTVRPPEDGDARYVLTGAEMIGHLRQVIAQIERIDQHDAPTGSAHAGGEAA